MSIRALPLALRVLSAACSPRFSRVYLDPDAPLEAALLPPRYGEVGFWVSHPAHVAVFEIAPDRGVSLLFPSLRGERNYMARAGSYNSHTLGRNVRHAYRNSWGTEAYLSPRYLFLIASREPLKLREIVGNEMALRARLEPAAFASTTPFRPMEALSDMVVPDQPDDNWTTAFYVVWGGSDRTPLGASRVISCGGGRVVYVPWTSWGASHACAGLPATSVAAPADSTPAPQPRKGPRKIKEGFGEGPGLDPAIPVVADRQGPEVAAPRTESDLAILRRATPGWVRSTPDGAVAEWGFLEGGPKAAIAGPRQEAGWGGPIAGRPGAGEGYAGGRGSSTSGSGGNAGPGASSGSSYSPPATVRAAKPQDPGASSPP